ncbi:unnamed protein product [Lactuca virosa]|uniref:Uncharacterized protein n=1 Tax=Lactuca virosa TaxID=75947 RepID=A0AAU9NQZ1_9ASTR|nr:unnamed protein product [Lactuca virosa]
MKLQQTLLPSSRYNKTATMTLAATSTPMNLSRGFISHLYCVKGCVSARTMIVVEEIVKNIHQCCHHGNA